MKSRDLIALLFISLLVLMLITACETPAAQRDRELAALPQAVVVAAATAPYETVLRWHDTEYGVVCWFWENGYGSSMSCISESHIKLSVVKKGY